MSTLTDLQILLNDSGVFWPTAQLLDALNEAQLWLYGELKWQRTSWPLAMVLGQDLIALPTTCLVPGWIEGTVVTSGVASTKRLFPTTYRELENHCRTWRSAELAAPTNFVVFDSRYLRVFPRPDKSYTYTLFGVGLPAEITDGTTDVVGDTNYTQAVQHYTLALLLEATRPDLADMHMGLAEEQTATVKKKLRNYQSHNIRVLTPSGSLFTSKQGGVINGVDLVDPWRWRI